LGILWRGWNKRKVAETAMNRESSRSHAVFMLTLATEYVQSEGTGAVTIGRLSHLNLVDLAGSERQGQTKNTGDRLREAGKINQSLSTLARVIRTLANNPKQKQQFVAYRDSNLTLLLRDSLGGNARTAVVVNIHPNNQFVGDTISTMQFAENVQKVKNTATVNKAETEFNEKLGQALKEVNEKHANEITSLKQQFEEAQRQIQEQKQEFNEKLDRTLQEVYEKHESEMALMKQELGETKLQYEAVQRFWSYMYLFKRRAEVTIQQFNDSFETTMNKSLNSSVCTAAEQSFSDPLTYDGNVDEKKETEGGYYLRKLSDINADAQALLLESQKIKKRALERVLSAIESKAEDDENVDDSYFISLLLE
jgi:hypothetical protein